MKNDMKLKFQCPQSCTETQPCSRISFLSKAAAPFYFPTSRTWGFQFLHMLTYTYYLSF